MQLYQDWKDQLTILMHLKKRIHLNQAKVKEKELTRFLEEMLTNLTALLP